MRDAIYDTDPRLIDTFTASRGWLEKFMSRNGLSLRRKTTVGQHDPAQLIDRLISNVLHVRRLLKTFHYTPSHIIGMDETSVWNYMIAETTVAREGKKTISL